MAVSTTDTYSGPFVPNGITVEFPFTFKAMSASEIRVELIDAAGAATIIGQDAYTVTLTTEGGSILFASAPVGASLYIISDPSFLQQIAFATGQAYHPATVNEANDRAAARDLVLKSTLERAAVIPVQGTTDGYIPVVRDGAFALEPSVEVQMEVIDDAVDRADDATDLALQAAASVAAFRINFKVTDVSQGVFELPITPTVTPELKVDGVTYPGPGSPDPIWVIEGNVITLAQDAYRDQIVSVSVGYASLLPQVQAENVVGFETLVPIAPFSQATPYAPGTIGDRFKRCVFVTDAPYLASPSKSPAFNQAAFNQAIADVGAAGGGVVYVPSGTYALTNANPPADIPGSDGDFDRDVIIDIQYDNVQLVGAGRGATVLVNTIPNSSYSHFVKIGRRVGGSHPVHNVQVRNLSIVGNWQDGLPSTTVYTASGVDVSSWCTNIRLECLSIDHCGGYGIGMQRDGFKSCTIRDVIITDVAHDGIDWKMDTNNSGLDNVIEHCTILRFGIVQDLIEDRQSGIDARQGVDVRDCYIGEYGAGLVGCRVNTPLDNGFVKKSIIDNIKCYAASASDTYGLHVSGNGTQVSNIYAGGCQEAIWFRGTNCQLVNLILNSSVNGLRVFAGGGETMQNNQFSNIRTTGNSGYGIRIDGGGAINSMVFTNVVSVSNTQGNLLIAANCADLMFIGGDIPSGIDDSGQDTRYIGVSGVWTDRGGRNKGQYIERSGDSGGNYLTGKSAAGVPKPFRIRSDANSGHLILEALAAGAMIQLGAGAPYAPSADAAITGTITILDAAGIPRKVGVVA